MHHKKRSAITLRNIPEDVSRQIRRRAEEEGISLNKAIIKLLQEHINPKEPKRTYHDLDHLAGAWTVEETREFDGLIKKQRTVDMKFWKSLDAQ